jgi:hypothetical protein
VDNIVTGLFTLLGALGGVLLGQWLQRKDRREAADERRRDEAAAILAPIKALVSDADPLRLGLFNPQQHLQESMPLLIEEWRSGREALLKLSLSHPSAQVRELAEQTQERCPDRCRRLGCFSTTLFNDRATRR